MASIGEASTFQALINLIKSKLGTAAYKNIPSTGDAGASEVVIGSDSRLSDSRAASDVYPWAKAATKPSYTANEVGAIPTSQKGVANGVASLDSTGKVPTSQLPVVEKTVKFRYNITTKATGGTTATITVDKYVDNALESSTDYKYSSLGSLVNIDDRFTLIYGSGNYVMTLLQNSEDHVAGYSTSWGYADTVNFSETYDVFMDDLSYIAAPFSEVVTYAVKNLVIHNGILYKCIAPHSAGAWDSSHFEETNVEKSFMMAHRDYVEAGRKAGTTEGANSTAEGTNTTSSGSNSHAEGYNTNATGNASHAEGSGTTTSAACSHAEGQNSQATSTSAHAEGTSSKASGGSSHAEGSGTTASGSNSHAEGEGTKANHQDSHAEGSHTQTGNNFQHVQGKFNVGKADTAFEIGNGTGSSNRSNAFEIDWNGNATFAGDVIATVDGVTIPLSDAQLQTLSSAITINGSQYTTVEGTLNALNLAKANTGHNHQVSDITDFPTLGDLASIDIDGVGSTKFLQGDGTWQNVQSGSSTTPGVGLTTGSVAGEIKANLASETYSTRDSETPSTTYGRQYPVVPDKNGKLSVNVPWTAVDIEPRNKSGTTNSNGILIWLQLMWLISSFLIQMTEFLLKLLFITPQQCKKLLIHI